MSYTPSIMLNKIEALKYITRHGKCVDKAETFLVYSVICKILDATETQFNKKYIDKLLSHAKNNI